MSEKTLQAQVEELSAKVLALRAFADAVMSSHHAPADLALCLEVSLNAAVADATVNKSERFLGALRDQQDFLTDAMGLAVKDFERRKAEDADSAPVPTR